MLEELGVEDDDANICQDMLEEDTSTMPSEHKMTEREMVHDYLKNINALKNHDFLYKVLTPHEKEHHHELLKQIQNFTIKCFAKASDVLLTVMDETPVQEDQAVPSTSGIGSRVTRTTTFYEPDDPDEPDSLHFGT